MKLTNMEAGRALDAFVAETVMGWSREQQEIGLPPGLYGDENFQPFPRYSTSIADAWEVVSKLDGEWTIEGQEEVGWISSFYSSTGGIDAIVIRESSSAITAPHAICLTALKAMEK
jgi:hypothetical protein